tara:strand:+ start:6389 stop:6679 length:291 start_codon:yes stop_codon:yes gene_type:complete
MTNLCVVVGVNDNRIGAKPISLIGDKMRYVRMNQISLDLNEVEAIEWKKLNEDEVLSEQIMYSVRIHLKSGKMYTRQIFKNQLEKLKEEYKEMIGE